MRLRATVTGRSRLRSTVETPVKRLSASVQGADRLRVSVVVKEVEPTIPRVLHFRNTKIDTTWNPDFSTDGRIEFDIQVNTVGFDNDDITGDLGPVGDGANNWYHRYRSARDHRCGSDGSYSNAINPPDPFVAQQWHHVALAWTAAGLDLSVDGGTHHTYSFTGTAHTGGHQIGYRFGQDGMVGYLKDYKVYDAKIGGNLIHHWPIDDDVAQGGEITDIVGSAHGTLTSMGNGGWEDA